MVCNIRSLSRHYNELLICLDKVHNSEPDIIILTETWLSAEQLELYSIKNYVSYIAERSDGTRSGGVVIFIREKIQHSHVTYSNEYFQAVSIEIKNKNSGHSVLKQTTKIIGRYL